MGTTPSTEGSERRQVLLRAAYDWVAHHGWAEMSLRPLAEAIGSSPRVLLFLFGTKDGLVRALLAHSRTDQLAVLDAIRSESPRDLTVVAEWIWSWLAEPTHRPLLRLWLEAYSRSVGSRPDGPWAGFAASTVTDWDALLAEHQPPEHRTTEAGAAERTLLLAVLRGCLLDLLATGDRPRLDAVVRHHLRR